LLDRIDIFSAVNPVSYNDITKKGFSESSTEIKKRVKKARDIQCERFKAENISCNSEMREKHLSKFCKLNEKSSNILEIAYKKHSLSTRAYSRILKVARTIADLSGKINIDEMDIIEALQYRKFVDENKEDSRLEGSYGA